MCSACKRPVLGCLELETLDLIWRSNGPNQFVFTVGPGSIQIMVTESYAMVVARGYGGGDATGDLPGEGGYPDHGDKLSQPSGSAWR